MMNVAAYLVKILEEEGLENIFGLPGEQILPFYKALKDSKINHVLVRHEQAAMHAADAHYKSSHKLSACVATAAPGALNFTMALAGAYKDNVPLLQPDQEPGLFQNWHTERRSVRTNH